ncbi:BT_3928 family protein [Sphingobacterium litopenaei]|uniref:DoxX family membrane protein n=1 Tax=Sphingobacterium litopenaei TaxID=2763500 RepID=A0ABR7YCG7_9SPHI|nr:BT_3928 family protein [Sphingobacterium litopenaei]MBD1428995.1 DoxX family membrane protein [Sphingobacterium litopenaei]
MLNTSYYTPLQKTSNKPDILLWISRVFVGLLFIFSGLIKANDPMGFGYKLQEYFHVFNLTFLNDYSAWIAIVICALEIILGILLLLGIARKSVAWGLLLLIIFFTFLTFYSAFFNVVTSCGCFGDAIPLTPWQSFIKDLILLVFIGIIFVKRNKITPIFKSSFANNVLTLFTFIFAFGAGIYTYKYLPILDFLPYKVGNNLPSLMKVPEGAPQDEFEHIYNLKNKQTGETKKVTDKEYMSQKIWEDENWEIVGEPLTKLIRKGYQVAIPDLMITDNEGQDFTQEIVENPHYNFVVTSVDVTKFSPTDFLALDKINQTIKSLSEEYNIRAVLLTASASSDVDYLNDQLDLVLETFYADAVPLKSMVRSNPGVMLLQNGIVIEKWSKDTFPSKEELINTYLK